MLNKPFFIATILSIALFLFAMIFSTFNNTLIADSLILISIFAFSLYIGFSYTKQNKKLISKKDRIKVASYFFIFWLIFIYSIFTIIGVMSPIKGNVTFILMHPKFLQMIMYWYFIFFATLGIISLILYWALGLGSKIWLKKSDNKTSLTTHPL